MPFSPGNLNKPPRDLQVAEPKSGKIWGAFAAWLQTVGTVASWAVTGALSAVTLAISGAATITGALSAATLTLTGNAAAPPVRNVLSKDLLPRAWAFCTIAAGVLTQQAGVNLTMTRIAVAQYVGTLTTPEPDANYVVVAMPSITNAFASINENAIVQARTASKFGLNSAVTGAAADVDSFSVIVFGN